MRFARYLLTAALALGILWGAAALVHDARAKGIERAAGVNAWHCHDWQDCP